MQSQHSTEPLCAPEIKHTIREDISCIASSPNEEFYVCGDYQGNIKFYVVNKRSEEIIVDCINIGGYISAIALVGNKLVTCHATTDKTKPFIQFWNIEFPKKGYRGERIRLDSQNIKRIGEPIPTLCQPHFVSVHDDVVAYGGFDDKLCIYQKDKMHVSFEKSSKNKETVVGCVLTKNLYYILMNRGVLIQTKDGTVNSFIEFKAPKFTADEMEFPTSIMQLTSGFFVIGDSSGRFSIWNLPLAVAEQRCFGFYGPSSKAPLKDRNILSISQYDTDQILFACEDHLLRMTIINRAFCNSPPTKEEKSEKVIKFVDQTESLSVPTAPAQRYGSELISPVTPAPSLFTQHQRYDLTPRPQEDCYERKLTAAPVIARAGAVPSAPASRLFVAPKPVRASDQLAATLSLLTLGADPKRKLS